MFFFEQINIIFWKIIYLQKQLYTDPQKNHLGKLPWTFPRRGSKNGGGACTNLIAYLPYYYYYYNPS